MRGVAALCALLLAGPVGARADAAGDAPLPQRVGLRVTVDATGRVQGSTALDPKVAPAYLAAAEAYARKLVFSPARKGGVAVPSETCLSLVLAAEPTGDGQFRLALRRAANGPGVVSVGRMELPTHQGRAGGASIVASVDVDAQGKPDMASFKVESAQLRVPDRFAEARYVDAVRNSVKHSVFQPDVAAGASVPSRLTLPYRFGRGGNKPEPGEEEPGRRAPRPKAIDPTQEPIMQGRSLLPDIELPSVDYTAPPSGA